MIYDLHSLYIILETYTSVAIYHPSSIKNLTLRIIFEQREDLRSIEARAALNCSFEVIGDNCLMKCTDRRII